ncbi:hypothetical protein QVD17_03692 [Tagetes erecta]|uniref:PGG domain-containing protein n=1 Tax=Tagetes erecta TaxID=13708 RepID=A0AAD8LG74_TARER|nr:hypothetical protein QVD17_03692 [Tagetes erecta]
MVRYSLNQRKETPLHVAAAGHNIKFITYLVNIMTMLDLELQNEDGNTAFCIAAISGNVAIAKILFQKNQALPIICGTQNMRPLYLAAFYGKRHMLTFLYNQSNRMIGRAWTNDDRDAVLLKCVDADFFEVALQILKDNEELPQDKHIWDMLKGIGQRRLAFPENEMRSFWFYVGESSKATRFLRFLCKRIIMERPKDVIDKISHILFIAARSNNRQFLVELIHEYPDLVWKRNDDGQTIFHISVSHRYHDIYSLIYEIGSMKDLIVPIRDRHGNNLLHLLGKSPVKTAYAYWVTSPFKMHSEYLWVKEVWGLLPPSCRHVKNVAGQTPRDLFLESHKDLASESMKWINATINVSMVVAALICTIGFSVVYQIPGGFDQTQGFPIFLHNGYFIAFVLLVAISFLLSTISIVFFISVFFSLSHIQMGAILNRMLTGQIFLFSSVFFLVMAFIHSFSIIYLKGRVYYLEVGTTSLFASSMLHHRLLFSFLYGGRITIWCQV